MDAQSISPRTKKEILLRLILRAAFYFDLVQVKSVSKTMTHGAAKMLGVTMKKLGVYDLFCRCRYL